MHKALICHYSEYFNRSCRGRLIEANTGQYDLREDDPVAFTLFVEWLYLHSRDKTTTVELSQTDTEEWRAYAERAWVIADKFNAPLFREYAFAKVIQNAMLMDSTRIQYINDNAEESSPICIFIGELVRWRNLVSSLRHNPRALASHPGGGVDPRRYPIQHWSEQCGQSGDLDCVHKPPQNHEPQWPLPDEPESSRFRLWYYRVLLGFLCIGLGLSAALISNDGPTPLFNFTLFMICFAIISLRVASERSCRLERWFISNQIGERGLVIAVGSLNLIFFFSSGCATAATVGAGSYTDASTSTLLAYGGFANSTVAPFTSCTSSSDYLYLAFLCAYHTVDGYHAWYNQRVLKQLEELAMVARLVNRLNYQNKKRSNWSKKVKFM